MLNLEESGTLILMNKISEIITAMLLWVVLFAPTYIDAAILSDFSLKESHSTKEVRKEHKHPIFSAVELKSMLDTAYFYYQEARYEKSIYFAEQVFMLSEKQGLVDLQVQSSIHLGRVNRKTLSFDIAVLEYKKAIDLCEFLSDSVSLLKAYSGIAEVYRKMGHLKLALNYLTKILDKQTAITDEQFLASTMNTISSVYKDLSDYELSLKYALDAARIREHIGDPKEIGSIYISLSNIYRHLKDYPNALKFVDKAMVIYVNEGKSLERVYNSHGIIAQHLGDYEAALRYFDLGYKAHKKNNSLVGMGRALSNISSVYSALGDFEKSLEIQFKAKQVKMKAQDITYYSSIYSGIANCLKNLERYDEAILYLDTALNLTQEFGHRSRTLDIYQSYSDLYKIKGDHQKALEYHVMSSLLKDSIFAYENMARISEINTIYELEQKEKENALLKRENEIQRAKNQQKTLIIIICGLGLVVVLFILLRIIYKHRVKKKNITNDQ